MSEKPSAETVTSWLAWFGALSEQERRLAVAQIIANSHAADRCRREAHGRWLRQQRDALIKIRQAAQEGLQQ